MTKDVCPLNFLRCPTPALCAEDGCKRMKGQFRPGPVDERDLSKEQKYALAMAEQKALIQALND